MPTRRPSTSRPASRDGVDAAAADTRFFGHPRGLATLFFTEMWERFSYYGMRALLILFMVAPTDKGGLGFPVAKAGLIYGMYTAMVYLLTLPGGWLADRIIGQRRAVLYGGILISAGQFCLMGPSAALFYTGLLLIILGTGLLKANVSTIVGQIYPQGDSRRDAGFSIFYMGINLGALISPILCGWVGERVGWRLGFGLAGFGMIAGLLQYAAGDKYLGGAGLLRAAADPLAARRQNRLAGFAAVGLLAAGALIAYLASSGAVELTAAMISRALGLVLVIISVAIFAWLLTGKGWTLTERKRSAALAVLFLASVLFWAAYEQAGSSLSLFAERNTDRHLFGTEFPASWFQFVPALFVVALAPVFAWFWMRLGRHQPSVPGKFVLGLVCAGFSFLILVPAARLSVLSPVSPAWLTISFLLSVIGELCLSPVGLSAITKLAPERAAGLMMGVWFLSIAIGDYLAGTAASLYEAMPLPVLFGTVAAVALGAGVVLALLIRPTIRLMSGVK